MMATRALVKNFFHIKCFYSHLTPRNSNSILSSPTRLLSNFLANNLRTYQQSRMTFGIDCESLCASIATGFLAPSCLIYSSICEAYFKKYPTRIGSLRLDALSLLLSMANVGAYSDVLVFDMVGGLLTGAVAERLGGTGYVCSTYFGTSRNLIDIVRMFNFSSEVNSRIVQASFTDLENECTSFHQHDPKTEADYQSTTFLTESVLQKGSMHVLEEEEEEAIQERNILSDGLCTSNVISNAKPIGQSSPQTYSNPPFEDGGENITVSSTAEKLRTPGRQASSEVVNSWKERGFSSLIVAAPEMEVMSLVQKLVPLLSYSAPFAIYNHCLQPLAMCMHKLQASKMAISLQISEPWLREYQVLPSRTHPQMQMSAFGGYILSGIRICSDAWRGSKEN